MMVCNQDPPPILVLQFRTEDAVKDQPILTGMRPNLNLATICERYILEQDGALTLFRIIDRFTVNGITEEMPLATIGFNLIVRFSAGEFRGPMDMRIRILPPTPVDVQELRIPVVFEAPEERAAQMVGQINVLAKEPGLFWIVVKLGEEEYTRIPFRIVYQRQPTIQTGT